MANLTRILTMTRADFHAADRVERWTARATWVVLTATAWLMVMFTTVWWAEVAGVPSGTVGWLAAALSPAVPLVSWIAVTSGPDGRPGAPALTVVLLLAAVVLAIAFI
ncbi:hypothetical protein AB0D10_42940 [Kitasatospora sp. NPDC048545]|uniref:hypothetical protein n=1 Tax=Kitasatospora sp. NPDC048545 TaxID=3157208 RepID=UPI0034010F07